LEQGEGAVIRESWLTALTPDAPCGPDLEYDQDYQALERSIRGKEETQYGDKVFPAREPVWPEVVELASALMARTRDLRVVHMLTRGLTHIEGLPGFVAGISFAHDLLDRHWDAVHPRIVVEGEVDPVMRMNALSAFADLGGSLRDVRAGTLVRTRAVKITVRDAERILDPAIGTSEGLAIEQLRAAISEVIAGNAAALSEPSAVLATLASIDETLRANLEMGARPDLEPLEQLFKPIAKMIEGVRAAQQITAAEQASEGAVGVAASTATPRAVSGVTGVVGELRTREDALRALDQVCDFLGRHEPTNPAPLLIRRAQRVMTMPFLDIIRELAPDATGQVEAITGARPES